MSTVSKCCSCGKVTWGVLIATAITLLVVGILASQTNPSIVLSQSGTKAMLAVGGTVLGLYLLFVTTCRCRETDGWLNRRFGF